MVSRSKAHQRHIRQCLTNPLIDLVSGRETVPDSADTESVIGLAIGAPASPGRASSRCSSPCYSLASVSVARCFLASRPLVVVLVPSCLYLSISQQFPVRPLTYPLLRRFPWLPCVSSPPPFPRCPVGVISLPSSPCHPCIISNLICILSVSHSSSALIVRCCRAIAVRPVVLRHLLAFARYCYTTLGSRSFSLPCGNRNYPP